MSRQHIDFQVPGTDKDSGEADNTAIKPVADGEPGQAAVFKRPSENLRTRTEFIRTAIDELKFLSDYDRQLLLTSTGTVTWAGLPTGTFTASADLTLKPFLAPNASSAARLLICAGTQAQITFRTRQNGVAGQPRAYNGANTITLDFTPVTTGTGAIVVTADGTPANNVHVQYDDHPVSGTTVDQIPANSMVQQFNASAVAIALGLEAVVEGTGTPVEVGFPTPPAPIAASLIKDYISVPEQATRYMAGAADAEKHNITPAHLTTFFADPLNVLQEGDVVAIRYDELVMVGDGGRRQSIDEFPEDKADDAGLNLFLVRRFPARLPLALPLAAVVNGQLIFINGRAYGSGESGPLIPAGSSYQGSTPNQWADTTTLPASSFEAAIDSIVGILGTKTGGTPGAIKVGFTPAGNIAANTVKGALEELDTEKAGLATANAFTNLNTFTPSVAGNGLTATGNGTGSGITATGGNTNGTGVIGTGFGAGSGGTFYAHSTSGPGNAALNGVSQSVAGSKGVWGVGTGAFQGGYFTGGSTVPGSFATRMDGAGVEAIGGAAGANGVVGRGGHNATIGTVGTAFANAGLLGVGSGAGHGVVGVSSASNNAAGVDGYGSTGVDGIGVRGTGTGAGHGVIGTGGATGQGVRGLGGSTSGAGVYGAAQAGTWPGVHGEGKTTGAGVVGLGDNAGVGNLTVNPVGGAFTGGVGQLTGPATFNSRGGVGITALGGAAGYFAGDSFDPAGYYGNGGNGINAVGGIGGISGHGVYGLGGTGQGDSGLGAGLSGAGGYFQGGPGHLPTTAPFDPTDMIPGRGILAYGGNGTGGSNGGTGVFASGGTSDTGTKGYGVYVNNGYIGMADTVNPANNVQFKNVLTQKNIVKAWGSISFSGGVATVASGFNILAAFNGTNQIDISFPGGATIVGFASIVVSDALGNRIWAADGGSYPFPCRVFDYTGAAMDISAQSGKFSVIIMVAQTSGVIPNIS